MSRLAGKVALVTGSGRGMGRVIALRLAEDGASVVINYAASRQGAEEVVETIRNSGGQAVAYQADITKRTEVAGLFESIDREPGRLDIVVNSAGVSGGAPLATMSDEHIEGLFGINLLAPLYVASEAARRLGEGGRIVNIGSSLAQFPIAGASVYAAAKSGLKSFTEVWAKELGPKGITVNTVVPGATAPGMAERTPPAYRDFYEKASPFGRIGRAEEIAAVVAFLCSPEASWVSGAHILANGAANA